MSSCATGSSPAQMVPFVTLEPDGQLKALVQLLELTTKHYLHPAAVQKAVSNDGQS